MATDQSASHLLEMRQNRLRIAKTTATPSGQIIDWIPIENQTPDGRIASPPPLRSIPARGEGERAATFEFHDARLDRGPAGTVPLLRPTLSSLTRTVTGKTGKRGGLLINRRHRNKIIGDPDPFGYFHASEGEVATVYGCDGFINVWNPVINDPPGAGDDHSIMQIWVLNNNNPVQSVEFGWTVDNGLNNDAAPHIFTYYTTNGYTQDGDNVGGYNRLHSGWVQVSATLFPGAMIIGVSKPGDQQVDISFQVQLHENNWWIAAEGILMGYYPASLFNGGIGNHATWASFGGEVYSSLENPSLTKDQMGSGQLATTGKGEAAYQRNLRIQSDLNGNMVNSNGSPNTDSGDGGPSPYDIDMHMNSGTAWGSYFYVGGPGTSAVA